MTQEEADKDWQLGLYHVALKEKISIIDGPDARLRVEVKDELRPPTRSEDPTAWEMLRDALKREGKYEEVSTVNANMFTYRIRNNIWPQDFVDRIRRYLRQQVTKTVKLIRKY